jgi:hypothetical protein
MLHRCCFRVESGADPALLARLAGCVTLMGRPGRTAGARRPCDDGQPDLPSGGHAKLPSGGHAKLPSGGQLDYLV